MYRPLSFVDRFFTERLETSNVTFDSEIHIARVECPTLILHAQDDRIVPIFLTRKVYSNQGGRRASLGHYIIYADKKKILISTSSTKRAWNLGLPTGLHYSSSNSIKTWVAGTNIFAALRNYLLSSGRILKTREGNIGVTVTALFFCYRQFVDGDAGTS